MTNPAVQAIQILDPGYHHDTWKRSSLGIKRLMDIGGSALASIMCAPLFLVMASQSKRRQKVRCSSGNSELGRMACASLSPEISFECTSTMILALIKNM